MIVLKRYGLYKVSFLGMKQYLFFIQCAEKMSVVHNLSNILFVDNHEAILFF